MMIVYTTVHAEKFKVIVADDKKAANTLISGTLQLQGFAVFSVGNALECLSRLDMEKGRIDVIYMVGRIATERSSFLIPRIRGINPRTKIVVILDGDQSKKKKKEMS